jgi:hypothetical protein
MTAVELKEDTEKNVFLGSGGAKYNWWHAHGLPDPNNPDEILAHRIKQEKIRKAETEEKFWNEVVVPKIKANVEEAKIEDFLLPAGEWENVEPQSISDPSDIKIGFR